MALRLKTDIETSMSDINSDGSPLVPVPPRRIAIVAAAFTALLFSVSMGMLMSFSAPATVDMKRPGSRFRDITPDDVTWIASLPLLTSVFGTAFSGFVSQRLGRIAVLMYISVPFTLGWLMIAYAPSLPFVFAGRLITGFMTGISIVAVPAYVVEISTVDIRGFLTTCIQAAFSLGILMGMGLGTVLRWSWLAVCGACVVVVAAMLMYFMPESPQWLVSKSRYAEAIWGLKFLKGKNYDALDEVREIKELIAEEPKTGMSWREILDPGFYKPMLIILALMLLQQLSGCNILISYAVELFQETKLSFDPHYATILIAVVQLCMTVISSLLMDRAGRKPLFICSGVFMAVGLVCLGVYTYHFRYSSAEELVHLSWIPVLSFAVYVGAYSLGFGPIPFVVAPELVPTRVRSFVLAIACITLSFFGFVFTKVFGNMRSSMGLSGCYWFYSFFVIIGCVFVWFVVPETKCRSIDEIHRSFSPSKGSSYIGRCPDDSLAAEDAYDAVPQVSDDEHADINDTTGPVSTSVDEYDEPWEWSVGARLTTSLQVSPAVSLDDHRLTSDPEDEEDEDMMARQRRLYETAFDSRVRRKEADDLDGLVQSPLLLGSRGCQETTVARAASRSSFGSTSGSSASSTPTHQPMEIARNSPHRHFTPTERRRVTLVRDSLPRSMSPQANRTRMEQPLKGIIVNQNFERKISLSGQWDNVSRCSGSDKSSSQESMNVELANSRNERNCVVERESRLTSNYPNNWKELSSAKNEISSDGPINVQNSVLHKEEDSLSSVSKKSASNYSGVKVLPTDNSPRFARTKSSCKTLNDLAQDPELKENNVQAPPSSDLAPRRPPSGLLSEVQPQSPDNDHRSSEDYDPPWDLKKNVLRPSGGVNGSVSVPERLSSGQQSGQLQMTTSVTHDSLESEDAKDRATAPAKLNKANGPSSRPNLNLNLNLGGGKATRQRGGLTLDFGCSALGAVGEKVDPQLTLEKQGWYHGSISRVDAEGKLRVLKEGSYLVRNSESSKHDYSLSLKSARGFMHMKIVPTSEGRFILGQFSNPFSSIPEMIQHYSVNKLPIKGAEHMSLLYPVIDQLL